MFDLDPCGGNGGLHRAVGRHVHVHDRKRRPCVCVCVCERERERARNEIYTLPAERYAMYRTVHIHDRKRCLPQRESSVLTTYWSIIVMIWWAGLAPWEFVFPFPTPFRSHTLPAQCYTMYRTVQLCSGFGVVRCVFINRPDPDPGVLILQAPLWRIRTEVDCS